VDFAYGIGLIVVAVVMIWVGRPKKGEDCRPWLRSYPVGQLYLMTTMVLCVFGATLLLTYWPGQCLFWPLLPQQKRSSDSGLMSQVTGAILFVVGFAMIFFARPKGEKDTWVARFVFLGELSFMPFNLATVGIGRARYATHAPSQ
jgi:hypothetical protein